MKRISEKTWAKVLKLVRTGLSPSVSAERAGTSAATLSRRCRDNPAYAAAIIAAEEVFEAERSAKFAASAEVTQRLVDDRTATEDALASRILAIIGGTLEARHLTENELVELLELVTGATVDGKFGRTNYPHKSPERSRLNLLLNRARHTMNAGIVEVAADPRAALAHIVLRKSQRRELRNLARIPADARTPDQAARIEELLNIAGRVAGAPTDQKPTHTKLET